MLASTNKKYKSIGGIGQNTTKFDRLIPIPIPEKKADTTDTDTIGASLVDEVVYRINEGQKVLGAVNRVFKSRNVGLNVKKCVYERVIVPTVLYGAETWGLRESERKKLNVFEMRCLRSMIGVTRRDRVRNTVIRERTGSY